MKPFKSETRVILLFDMDGVLLEASGYHRALQDTVALIAQSLGFHGVRITQEDIDLFEAVGVTSEWDSSAICTALLLDQVWKAYPERKLPADPTAGPRFSHQLPPPDFRSFYNTLSREPDLDISPLDRAEGLFFKNRNGNSPEQMEDLRNVLRHARGIQGSLTHRLFQEMVLGSRIFEESYQLSPFLYCDSYISLYDRPHLDTDGQKWLRSWIRPGMFSAAIFTNRPSRAPQGFFFTPEAEIGAQAAGVEYLPIAGLGALSWFAGEQGLNNEAFLKPSPVHVLTALRLAAALDDHDHFDEQMIASLHAALSAKEGIPDSSWKKLSGARVFVFEDSVKGLHSAQAAQDALKKIGVSLQMTLCGITNRPPKIRSLSDFGALVFPSLMAAFRDIPLSK